MDILKRELAPLAREAWKEIDDRAVQVLKTHLSARKIGGDFSIGYEHHDSKSVQLFISESFTFRVTDPAVIIPFTM